MSFSVIVPARFASTRLPGKALVDLAGRPMIAHVVDRALESGADAVWVATDDERIAAAVPVPAGAVLTDPDLPTGTDRIAAAARALELPSDAVVVNVQGDEPLLPPRLVAQVAALLTAPEGAGADMATLCLPLDEPGQLTDPDVVKVVRDRSGNALWFSRAPLPWNRDGGGAVAGAAHRRHLGLYAYRAAFLQDFVAWPRGVCEALEALEQLRALEQGARIRIADALVPVPPGVDTEADLERVRRHLGGA